jgi:TRAP transporter TAXI family solute receptor
MHTLNWAPAARAALSLALIGTASSLQAQEVKLPPTLTFTAYDTGSSGFGIAVAVGKMLKDNYKSEVRVLPAGNDVARLGPLKAGRANLSAMGIGSYFAQEGIFEFAVKDWGPQALQMVVASTDCNVISLGVAKDAGVKEVKDLKGKRIGFVVGSPALNQNALAILAFGGLTRQDVTIAEFASYGAMWKGILNNEVDAAIASNISGQSKEAESSPRGLLYPRMPHSDADGWARVAKVAPYYTPHKATCGISASKEAPLESSGYPYPIFVVQANQPDDVVYGIAKAMNDGYNDYKDAVPGASGLNPKTQNFQWVLPVHPAAVKAFKDAKIWKDADEAHNQKLLARQKVLADAWAAFNTASAPDEKAAFQKAWMDVRKAALQKAGMDPIFE